MMIVPVVREWLWRKSVESRFGPLIGQPGVHNSAVDLMRNDCRPETEPGCNLPD